MTELNKKNNNQIKVMDYSKAKQAVEQAIKKAEELDCTISVAVVDAYGDLLAFGRMKGALKISPKFAIAKAFTSGTLGLATADMAPYATEGKPYFGMNSLFGGKLTTIAGGLPVMKGDELVGGIGVGGSHDVAQDVECAKAGLGALDL